MTLDAVLLASCRGGPRDPGRRTRRRRRRLLLLWLVIALPLAGAVVLLLGGALRQGRLDKVGHWLGTATAARLLRAQPGHVRLACSAATRTERQVGQHLFTWFEVGGLDVGMDLLYDPLLGAVPAADHRRRLADPRLLDRLHGARRRAVAASSATSTSSSPRCWCWSCRPTTSACSSAGRASAWRRTS